MASISIPQLQIGNLEDQAFIDKYLAHKAESSNATAAALRSQFKRFFDWYSGSLADLTFQDAEEFAYSLKSIEGCLAYKKQHITNLRKMMRVFLVRLAKKNKEPLRANPFDTIETADFFGKARDEKSLKEEQEAELDQTYDLDQIKALLVKAQQISMAASPHGVGERAFFIITLLQVFSNPRIGENCTIMLENVDLKERIIKSGLVKDARKSGSIHSFFPPVVASFIREYVLQNKVTGKWLFPSWDEFTHISTKPIMTLFKTLGFKSHHFRHTYATDVVSEAIKTVKKVTNHAENAKTIENFYVRSKILQQRDLYDATLTPMYQQLAKWLETL